MKNIRHFIPIVSRISQSLACILSTQKRLATSLLLLKCWYGTGWHLLSVASLQVGVQVMQEVESHWTSGRSLPDTPFPVQADGAHSTLHNCFVTINAGLAYRQHRLPASLVSSWHAALLLASG